MYSILPYKLYNSEQVFYSLSTLSSVKWISKDIMILCFIRRAQLIVVILIAIVNIAVILSKKDEDLQFSSKIQWSIIWDQSL